MSKKKEKVVEKRLCVNLGCGNHIVHSTDPKEKWINIDSEYKPEDSMDYLQGDVRAIPLESGTVDYILCDNVLEHLSMADIPIALHEIRRVLKVGGRAVLIVPEFKDALNQWLSIDHDNSFSPFNYQYLSEVIYGLQTHDGEYHRTPFCAGFMNYSLQMCGLRKYRLVLHPAFSDSPNYPGTRNLPGAKCRNAQLIADITKES